MIFVFYFFLGVLLQLPDLAVRFFMMDRGLDVASLAAFQATLVIPWCLKPLYGFLSDSCPLCGFRRKPYVTLANVINAGLWFTMAATSPPVWAAQMLLFTASMMTCFSDVMYDSILVEIAKAEDEHGVAQSRCWGARAVGALIAAIVGGVALDSVPPTAIFVAEGVILAAVAAAALFIKEVPSPPPVGTLAKARMVLGGMRNPALWKPALFVFIFAATPSSYTAFFFFLVSELHFSASFLGVLTCIRHAAMLAGTVIFSRYLRYTNYRKFFFILVLVSGVFGATPIILVTHVNAHIGLPNGLFAAGDDLFLSVIGQVALMPCLILAAKLCPRGIEASVYASFVSILNFAGIFSEYSGAFFTFLLGVTKPAPVKDEYAMPMLFIHVRLYIEY